MPLSAGPFILQYGDNLQITPEVYDFTSDAQQLAHELADIDAQLVDPIATIEAFNDEALIIDLFPDVDDLLVEASNQLDRVIAADVNVLDDFYDVAVIQLTAAEGFAPAESWSDPPPPYEPPGSQLTLTVPLIDTTAFIPPNGIVVGSSPPDTGPFVSLYNVTRVGSINFTVGDIVQVAARGNPGDDVSVQATFNGEALPLTSLGATDARGLFGLQVTEGPENVGAWSENWYIAGQLVTRYSFVVSPSQT